MLARHLPSFETLRRFRGSHSAVITRSTILEWSFLAAILVFFTIRCGNVIYNRFEPEILLDEYAKSIREGRIVPDRKIYPVAGWIYVQGGSPDTVNFEHPPLAKYMIGLSELAFVNQAVLSLAFSALTLVVVFLISRMAFRKYPVAALIAPLLLSMDRLYLEFSQVPTLDIYATFFASLSVLLLISERRWAKPLFFVTMGMALSSKWTTAFLLVIPPLYYALKRDWRHLRSYPLYLMITGLTYAAGYLAFFLAGHTPQDLVDLQLRMVTFHQEKHFMGVSPRPLWIQMNFLTGIQGPAKIFNPLNNFQNGTVVWMEPASGLGLIHYYNPLTWPLSFSASILTLAYAIKTDRRILPVPLGFLLLLFSFPVGNPYLWWLIPGLPFAFLCLAYVISKTYTESKNKKAATVAVAIYLASVVIWSLFANLPPYIVT